MNIKKIMLGLITSTIISTAGIANEIELRDSFRGVNGGIRVINNIETVDNITTFTITTTNRRGITKTKEFTATKNGDSFDISGNGRSAFKDWLRAHAAQHQNINVETSITDNEIAFNAYKTHKIEEAKASGSIWVSAFETMRFDPSNNYIDLAENAGLNVNFNASSPVEFSSALHNIDTELNNYNTYNTQIRNTVDRSDNTACHIGFNGALCDASHDVGKQFNIEKNDITNIVKNEDGTVTITANAAPSVFYRGNWYLTSLDKTDEITVNATPKGDISKLTVDALAAHAEGIDGTGINVGVFDVPSDSTTAYSSYGLHGDHTDDIIKAFAPGANTTRIYDEAPDGTQYTGIFSFAREYENLNTQDIVNYSHGYGAGQTRSPDSLKRYYNRYSNNIKDDLLIVVAAGNDGHISDTRNNSNAATVILTEDRPETTIVAGALNFTGDDLASYSNHAGYVKDNFLATSAVPFPENMNDQGTSFSAPVIAASAALVMQKFNFNAEQTVDRLFETADDLGAPGVDSKFGHGRLNLGAALGPIGNLR